MPSNETSMDFDTIHIDPVMLADARRRAGIGQSEAARLVGISRQALWNFEDGRRCPGARTLARLCALYGVPISDLTKKISVA